jgi:hypothetical protein
MTARYDEQIVSDIHKSAYGARPSQGWWAWWADASEEDRNDEWDRLCDASEREAMEEADREDRAIRDYESRLVELQTLGAADREQAKRWLVASLDLGVMGQDPDYVAWELGLPGRMQGEFERG